MPRKINTAASSVEDKDILTKPLVTPSVRVIDLQFQLGTVVTARNKFGVTIKDALDAIYKTQKKKVGSIPLDTPRPHERSYALPSTLVYPHPTNVWFPRPTMSSLSRT